MNVLVSGGLGFIGERIAARLIERGDRVRVLDNELAQVHADDRARKRAGARGIEVVRGDVRVRADWDAALAGVEAVYHMAAETGTGQSMSEVARYCETNVTGTALLCEALARGTGVQTVFLPSSRAIYGEGAYRCAAHGIVFPARRTRERLAAGDFALRCPADGAPVEPIATAETAQPHPASVYATTKQTQEQLLQHTCGQHGIALRIARYQNVYGPGQSLNNPYTGVLAIFARQIGARQTLNIYEDGKIVRDFVYVDDVVEASLRLSGLAEDPGPLNIGSGRPADLFAVIAAFEAAFGRPVPYAVSGDFRFGDIRCAFADLTRARAALGAPAPTSLESGLRRLVDWVRSGDETFLHAGDR